MHQRDFITFMPEVQKFHHHMNILSEKWDLLTILGSMSHVAMDTSETRREFEELLDEPLRRLIDETLSKSLFELESKAQAAIDILIRNLFERTADIGFLATDDDIRDYLLFLDRSIEHDEWYNDQSMRHGRLIERFEEYVAKYSVYSNIILFSPAGKMVAQLDKNQKISASRDRLIHESIHTHRGYVETFTRGEPEGVNPGLLYSYRITDPDDETRILGILCLVFKFEDEMEAIYRRFTTDNPYVTLALLDECGFVISSSSPHMLPVGARPHTGDDNILYFAGNEYLYQLCPTLGYQGYTGPGWRGLALIPVPFAFRTRAFAQRQGYDRLFDAVWAAPAYFPERLREILRKAQAIQSDLEVTVWNGNARIAQSSSHENPFSKALLEEISKTGRQTKNVFDTSIANLNRTMITSLMDNLEFQAALAIDIMDRNLYERANDCRWWALTASFRTLLSRPVIEDDARQMLSERLSQINALYTVYSDMMIFDRSGTIVAVSRRARDGWLGRKITGSWGMQTLALNHSSRYAVSAFEPTVYYDGRPTYIYSAVLRADDGSAVGGIAVVFDGANQFPAMLDETLPKDADGNSEGLFSLFTDSRGTVIASTHPNIAPMTVMTQLPERFLALRGKDQTCGIVEYDGMFYAVGAASSSGYREYKGQDGYENDIVALIFKQIGATSLLAEQGGVAHRPFDYPKAAPGESTEHFSTFYVGDILFAVESSRVVCSLTDQELTTVINPGPCVLGLITHSNRTVGIVSLACLLGQEKGYRRHNDTIVIVNVGTPDKHTCLGLVVDAIADSPVIPSRSVSHYTSVLKHDNSLTKGVILPDTTQEFAGAMPSILDIDRIYAVLMDRRQTADAYRQTPWGLTS